jgi:hypothetical protein
MDDDLEPDIHQNPYHPYEETDRCRAFREGWSARREGTPVTGLPYPLARLDVALAWLDGWTAARKAEEGADADLWAHSAARRRPEASEEVPA